MSAGTRHTSSTALKRFAIYPPNVVSLKGDGLGDPEVIAIGPLRSLKELDLSGCEEAH